MSDAFAFTNQWQDNLRAFQQNLLKLHPGAGPLAWPMSAVQSFWVETPLEVATHLQKFTAGQVQAQLNLFTDLSREDGPANLASKELAFLQQSAMAWNTEWLEIASLIQTKLLSAAQKPAEPGVEPYPLQRAA
ncbi:hypothetical protein [Azorhizobium]|nr:hypothetical protein [Azorhizobium]TDU01102.1 hypothetical protein DFO45_0616 [Azorhizobium sp. AG788]